MGGITLTEEYILTLEEIDRFVDLFAKQNTKDVYKTTLLSLYNWLPEDKKVTPKILYLWRYSLEHEQNYALRTVNQRVSVANKFFKIRNMHNFFCPPPKVDRNGSAASTKKEYLQLLKTAKERNLEKIYYLVKLFGSIEYRVTNLNELTVENLKKNQFCTSNGDVIVMPELLREDLLEYAARHNIDKGPIFLSGKGTELPRTTVSCYFRKLARYAHVDEKHASQRALQNMVCSTRDKILEEIKQQVEEEYFRNLCQEESFTWTRGKEINGQIEIKL